MRRLLSHGAAAVWILVTAASLVLPVDPDLQDHFPWLPLPVDKVAHFFLFLICCWLLHRSFALELSRGALVAAAISSLAYGAATELLQTWVPARSGDPLDLLADALGIAVYVGWAIGTPWSPHRSTPERS